MSSRIDGMNETGADQGSTPGRVGEVRRGSRQVHIVTNRNAVPLRVS